MMKFKTQDDVTDPFGPKAYGDLTQTNWAVSRYVPWSSWASVANIWPNASGNTSVEGESSAWAAAARCPSTRPRGTCDHAPGGGGGGRPVLATGRKHSP